MKRTHFAILLLAVLLVFGAIYQVVDSSPLAKATIGSEEAPKTVLHMSAGRQLYPLRISARVDSDYQGDARLQLIGNLPAELTMINIGPMLHPTQSRNYTLNGQQLKNLKAGDQVDLLILLRSTGAPLAIDPDQAAALPACCQVPADQQADGKQSPVEPALVLFDPDKLQKLWTIPLRLDLQDPKT